MTSPAHQGRRSLSYALVTKGYGSSADSRQRAPLACLLPNTVTEGNLMQSRNFQPEKTLSSTATDALGKFQCREAQLSWRNRTGYEEENEMAWVPCLHPVPRTHHHLKGRPKSVAAYRAPETHRTQALAVSAFSADISTAPPAAAPFPSHGCNWAGPTLRVAAALAWGREVPPRQAAGRLAHRAAGHSGARPR